MSNEITLQVTLNLSHSGFSDSNRVNLAIDQTTLGASDNIVSVPTSATTYAFSNLTNYGYAFLQNLDATNFVTYGISAAGPTYCPVGKLLAGEVAVLRLSPGITFQAKADTASCKVLMKVYEA